MEDIDNLIYRGEALRDDADGVLLRLADGAEIDIPAAGIAWRETTPGPHDTALTSLRVHPQAEIRARFTAGAARLGPATPTVLPLVAYERGGASDVSLVPGEAAREWMNATDNRFANRCLPLLIANQHGWMMLNTNRFAATWNGGMGKDSILVEHFDYAPGMTHYAMSHFGHGVLTISLPYLIRTPPGYNLYVRGPANLPKDGISALSGIVETDWSDSTFTMNWIFTRPNHRVTFEEDEPIAMLSPIRRGEIERFRPVFRSMDKEPEVREGFDAFTASRADFNANLANRVGEERRALWQRHYMRGETVTGKAAREHQTSLTLARFVEEDPGDC
jgi:hypothetical protein